MDFGGVAVEKFGIESIILFQIIPECRDPSNDGDVLIAHLSVPLVSNLFAKERMEI